jgi:hypothetical protein
MAKKAAARPSILVFKKEWIYDPGPEWLNVNRATLSQIAKLKEQFTKTVNAAIKAGQQG